VGVEQETVSRLERRADLVLSSLSSYVAAMGGKLRLVAEVPNRRPVAIVLADMIVLADIRVPTETTASIRRPFQKATGGAVEAVLSVGALTGHEKLKPRPRRGGRTTERIPPARGA